MKTAPWIIIIVLIAMFSIHRECNRCPEFEPVSTIIETEYIIDSTATEAAVVIVTERIPGKQSGVPAIVYIDRIETVPADIDSAAVAKAYFTSRVYKDVVIVDDSNMHVSIDAEVFMNQLMWVKPVYKLRRPQTIIYKTTTIIQEVEKHRNRYYAGIAIGRSLTNFGLGTSIALLSKEDHLYSLSYDFINKDAYFTLYYKIR